MKKVPAPNLLPMSRLQSRRRDSALRLWTGVIFASLLLVAAPSAMLSIHLRSAKPVDSDHVNRFVEDLRQLQEALPPLQSQLSNLQIASHSKRIAESRIQWPIVLNRLAQTTNEDVRIHSFSANVEQSSATPQIVINLQAQTKSLSQAREFLVILEDIGLFDDIRMVDSRRQSSASDSLVNSTIQARIQTSPVVGVTP